MYIGLTPELEELRDELRDYYAKLLTPEVEAELSTGEGIGPVPRKIWKQMAADGWAGIGWPEEYGGQGRTAIEQFIFFDESMRVGAPVPMLTINSVAPTIMRYGTQEQKDFYLPKILAGEIHFSHRVHRARRRHGPRVAEDPGRPRRRRVRHQRPEGLHLARIRLRLRLARGAHRPERQEAQGHLDHHRPDRHARLQVRAHQEHGWPRHERHVLRGRAGARRQPRRRREPGLEPHHQPAQPRAGHALLQRGGRAPARGHDRLGRGHEERRRHPRDRPGVGADQPGQGARRSSSSCGSRTSRSRPRRLRVHR